MPIERKLAAIMFTDIAGYTEQMSQDEDKAFALIQKKRELLLPLIEQYEGKLIKEIGDGTLTRYFKADNAIDCASTFQSQTDTDLNVRAGIHTGEVIVDKEDVFGDVVNVASRLESIAVPGSVLVSKETIDKLEMSDKLELVSLGMQSLKGVGRLIEVYAIKGDGLVIPNPDDYLENKIDVHSDDEVPSIAIIPFENKGKEEDAFYAYSISADLISDVSSAGLIRVASKKQIDDAGKLPQDELAKKLDVRYITHGELWKMVDMFQLSIELYDTKDKKVIWSDRWQEEWENLPTIKINLTDGLLKALDTTSKVDKKVETTNTKAYELFLKAKYKYEKRKNADDVEIVRGMLANVIKFDNNLITAKILLGTTYRQIGEYDNAMKIYTPAYTQAKSLDDKCGMGLLLNTIGLVHKNKGDHGKALDYLDRSLTIHEELGNKREMGHSLHNIGVVHSSKGDYDKALDYYGRSLTIHEELGDKRAMGTILNNIGSLKGDYDKALEYHSRALTIHKELGDKRGTGISFGNIGNVHLHKGDHDKALDYYGRSLTIYEELSNKRGTGISFGTIGIVYSSKGDYDKALDYYGRSLTIDEELGHKNGIGVNLNNIGNLHTNKGDYDKALDYYGRSLTIQEELGDKVGIGHTLGNIGGMYAKKSEYGKAEEYLEKSLFVQTEIGLFGELLLWTTTYLYLTYNHFDKKYDDKEIHKLIKEAENIEFEINLRLYELLEDTSYLETAYNQAQERADSLEPDVAAKFLSYPIPKAIVKEYNKVFKK